MTEVFLGGKIVLHCGDMLAVLPTLADNSIDSCVCDPPYHLTSIVKRFGEMGPNDKKLTKGRIDPFQRTAVGFMNEKWDGGDIAFQIETWAQVLHVLKPGAHLVAFGGTRTFARMSVAIEDAGFEIRDTIMWVYGSGFPKSHDVSKGIDRANGDARPIAGTNVSVAWEGWGTALKPACEPIVLARKPLSEGTVAANVLKWGTGAINVDGCRVATDELTPCNNSAGEHLYRLGFESKATIVTPSPLGRWPANLIHDGSEEVLAGFPDAPGQQFATGPQYDRNAQVYGKFASVTPAEPRGDSGSAARYFYTAKADSDDRLGSKHPTVKPLDLMQYLVRLVTPKGGVVLDCFAGTGTTGEAAFREGMCPVLIEREAEYQADIRRRMGFVLSGPEERARAAIKQRMNGKPRDDGPLFGGTNIDERGGADRFTESLQTNDWSDRTEVVNE